MPNYARTTISHLGAFDIADAPFISEFYGYVIDPEKTEEETLQEQIDFCKDNAAAASKEAAVKWLSLPKQCQYRQEAAQVGEQNAAALQERVAAAIETTSTVEIIEVP